MSCRRLVAKDGDVFQKRGDVLTQTRRILSFLQTFAKNISVNKV